MHGNLEPEETVLEKTPTELQNFTVYSKVGCPYCTNQKIWVGAIRTSSFSE